jgi:hypothetical protein
MEVKVYKTILAVQRQCMDQGVVVVGEVGVMVSEGLMLGMVADLVNQV